MGVEPKIGGFYPPKMDGENNGSKPHEQMEDFFLGKNTYTPIFNGGFHYFHHPFGEKTLFLVQHPNIYGPSTTVDASPSPGLGGPLALLAGRSEARLC